MRHLSHFPVILLPSKGFVHYPRMSACAPYPSARDEDPNEPTLLRGETATEGRVTPTIEPGHECDDRRVSSVLIVDDDPAFLALSGRIVRALGVGIVVTAANAAQALEVAVESRSSAMLVDVGLPDRDGIDLAYELSGLPWAPRVVVTSSDREAAVALEARGGNRSLPFIAKEELADESLRAALLDR